MRPLKTIAIDFYRLTIDKILNVKSDCYKNYTIFVIIKSKLK